MRTLLISFLFIATAVRGATAFPQLFHFAKGTDHLSYLASSHSYQADSATFRLITDTFRQETFSIVVLEGFPRSRGISPPSLIKYAQADGVGGVFRGGETTFAIQNAVARSIPFVGGEPDEQAIAAGVMKAGYTLEDLACFYFVRQIPQFKAGHQLDAHSARDLYPDFMASVAQGFHVAPGALPDYGGFMAWYRQRNGVDFAAAAIDTETVAPYPHGNLFTQRLSAAVGEQREVGITATLQWAIREKHQVLVIYGGDHFAKERAAIEALLGAPIAGR